MAVRSTFHLQVPRRSSSIEGNPMTKYSLQVWEKGVYVGAAISSNPLAVKAFGEGYLRQFPSESPQFVVEIYDPVNPLHDGTTLTWENFLAGPAKAPTE